MRKTAQLLLAGLLLTTPLLADFQDQTAPLEGVNTLGSSTQLDFRHGDHRIGTSVKAGTFKRFGPDPNATTDKFYFSEWTGDLYIKADLTTDVFGAGVEQDEPLPLISIQEDPGGTGPRRASTISINGDVIVDIKIDPGTDTQVYRRQVALFTVRQMSGAFVVAGDIIVRFVSTGNDTTDRTDVGFTLLHVANDTKIASARLTVHGDVIVTGVAEGTSNLHRIVNYWHVTKNDASDISKAAVAEVTIHGNYRVTVGRPASTSSEVTVGSAKLEMHGGDTLTVGGELAFRGSSQAMLLMDDALYVCGRPMKVPQLKAGSFTLESAFVTRDASVLTPAQLDAMYAAGILAHGTNSDDDKANISNVYVRYGNIFVAGDMQVRNLLPEESLAYTPSTTINGYKYLYIVPTASIDYYPLGTFDSNGRYVPSIVRVGGNLLVSGGDVYAKFDSAAVSADRRVLLTVGGNTELTAYGSAYFAYGTGGTIVTVGGNLSVLGGKEEVRFAKPRTNGDSTSGEQAIPVYASVAGATSSSGWYSELKVGGDVVVRAIVPDVDSAKALFSSWSWLNTEKAAFQTRGISGVAIGGSLLVDFRAPDWYGGVHNGDTKEIGAEATIFVDYTNKASADSSFVVAGDLVVRAAGGNVTTNPAYARVSIVPHTDPSGAADDRRILVGSVVAYSEFGPATVSIKNSDDSYLRSDQRFLTMLGSVTVVSENFAGDGSGDVALASFSVSEGARVRVRGVLSIDGYDSAALSLSDHAVLLVEGSLNMRSLGKTTNSTGYMQAKVDKSSYLTVTGHTRIEGRFDKPAANETVYIHDSSIAVFGSGLFLRNGVGIGATDFDVYAAQVHVDANSQLQSGGTVFVESLGKNSLATFKVSSLSRVAIAEDLVVRGDYLSGAGNTGLELAGVASVLFDSASQEYGDNWKVDFSNVIGGTLVVRAGRSEYEDTVGGTTTPYPLLKLTSSGTSPSKLLVGGGMSLSAENGDAVVWIGGESDLGDASKLASALRVSGPIEMVSDNGDAKFSVGETANATYKFHSEADLRGTYIRVEGDTVLFKEVENLNAGSVTSYGVLNARGTVELSYTTAATEDAKYGEGAYRLIKRRNP